MRVYHKYIQQGMYTPANATGLLIGTFPSILVREAFNRRRPTDVDFFYGSADNNFWKDLGIIYNRSFRQDHTNAAIEERIQLLNKIKLGLSDAILSCETTGSAMDLALQNIELNTSILAVLDECSTIDTLYFTSSSGKTNAETLTLQLLRHHNRLRKMQILQKSGPRIRQFIYTGKNGDRLLKTVTLFSPSPLAEQWGVNPEKRRAQYREYLPKLT